MIKKNGQIHDKVSNHWKKREGFNQNRVFQEVFDMGWASQDIFAIDSHGTRATYSSPTGIAERERSILFILNAHQSLQEIHSFSDLHLKGFDPLGRILLLMEPFYFQG